MVHGNTDDDHWGMGSDDKVSMDSLVVVRFRLVDFENFMIDPGV